MAYRLQAGLHLAHIQAGKQCGHCKRAGQAPETEQAGQAPPRHTCCSCRRIWSALGPEFHSPLRMLENLPGAGRGSVPGRGPTLSSQRDRQRGPPAHGKLGPDSACTEATTHDGCGLPVHVATKQRCAEAAPTW